MRLSVDRKGGAAQLAQLWLSERGEGRASIPSERVCQPEPSAGPRRSLLPDATFPRPHAGLLLGPNQLSSFLGLVG